MNNWVNPNCTRNKQERCLHQVRTLVLKTTLTDKEEMFDFACICFQNILTSFTMGTGRRKGKGAREYRAILPVDLRRLYYKVISPKWQALNLNLGGKHSYIHTDYTKTLSYKVMYLHLSGWEQNGVSKFSIQFTMPHPREHINEKAFYTWRQISTNFCDSKLKIWLLRHQQIKITLVLVVCL